MGQLRGIEAKRKRGQNKIGGRGAKQRGVRVRSLRRVEMRRKSCMKVVESWRCRGGWS